MWLTEPSVLWSEKRSVTSAGTLQSGHDMTVGNVLPSQWCCVAIGLLAWPGPFEGSAQSQRRCWWPVRPGPTRPVAARNPEAPVEVGLPGWRLRFVGFHHGCPRPWWNAVSSLPPGWRHRRCRHRGPGSSRYQPPPGNCGRLDGALASQLTGIGEAGQGRVCGVVFMVSTDELAAGSRPRLAADAGRRTHGQH
jgi:hypothetical protein